MASFFNWLSRKSGIHAQPPAISEVVYAPNTNIPYRPDLIDGLQDDHQQLGRSFGELVAAVDDGKPREVRAALDEFEGLLYDHLLREKTSFYIYIRGIYADNESMLELVNYFSREMDSIQREIIRFFRRHKHSALSPQELQVMKKELDGLGAALTDRIQREESQLYPLYLQPDEVDL